MGFLATLSFSATKLQNYRPPENAVVLEISQSLEMLQLQSYSMRQSYSLSFSKVEWERKYQRLEEFAQRNGVLNADSLALARALMQVSVREQELEKELKEKNENSQSSTGGESVSVQMSNQKLKQELEQAQKQEHELEQKLIQVQIHTQELVNSSAQTSRIVLELIQMRGQAQAQTQDLEQARRRKLEPGQVHKLEQERKQTLAQVLALERELVEQEFVLSETRMSSQSVSSETQTLSSTQVGRQLLVLRQEITKTEAKLKVLEPKLLEVQRLEQDKEQVKAWAEILEQKLTSRQVQIPRQLEALVTKLEANLAQELNQKFGQAPKTGNDLRLALDYSRQAQQEQLVLIGSALLCLMLFLTLLSSQNTISLSSTEQLNAFIPEECVAELGALHDRLQSHSHSIWLVRLIIIWAFLELFWAFYIQIKLENLWLPQKGDTSKIDE